MKIKMADRKKHVLSIVVKNISFQNKTLLVMFYRHNKTIWCQFCNFKHFLKAENNEDSLASSCEEFCISFRVTTYTRNTPGLICQYKEDGLVSRPPSLFTSMHRPMHGTSCPKSLLKSTCLTAKFGSFLDHTETGEKGQNVISSSVQHPISLIFAIHVSFIIPLPMMWIFTCIHLSSRAHSKT